MPRAPAKPAAPASAIPRFALYGEDAVAGQEVLHIEEVRDRSSLYQWEISPHTHLGLYQLLWLRQGTVAAVLDGAQQSLAAPVAIVVPPGVVHGFKFAPGTEGLVLTVSTRFLLEGEFQPVGERFCAQFDGPAILPMLEEQPLAGRIGALLHNLQQEFHAPLSGGSPAVLWLARALVWLLTQALPGRSDGAGGRSARQRQLVNRFLALLENHLLQHWSLAQYAQRLGLPTQRLNRLTREMLGQSALEVVHARLTREACRRLIYTAAPVGNLAAELGFEDAAYFSRFFKKRTGQTPLGFRQQRDAHLRAGALPAPSA